MILYEKVLKMALNALKKRDLASSRQHLSEQPLVNHEFNLSILMIVIILVVIINIHCAHKNIHGEQ